MAKNTNSKLIKWINWILFFLFASFAYVQLNDPDPYIWVLIYGSVSVLFGLSNFMKVPRWIHQFLIAAFLLYAIFHLGFFYDWLMTDEKSEIFGEMVYKKPYIEGTREFLGLLIAGFSLLFLYKNSK
ncbi:transmembrane 220 family protein [Lutimonas zeaxanthinifaciens]|uniref:transmembrane 220 family protein n=1 Tax=Lutimonas zeaxanthinifaciens TaxID=3060215 RepID=UPI00265CBFF4|nr:transmembrane 220 family protein [Lutimonas sp. YSD2104]WKK65659.1 transmembrane 220 family protein [Lutimonas sp. YSD2104]